MRTIEVDDEVYAYLQSEAIAYIETPNLTLRRLFNLNGKGQMRQSKDKMGKKPKANLQKLIESGLLQEDQTLYLYDYQGRRIEGYEAIVSGNSLLRNGKPYAMSRLAKEDLKEKGFTSESVRGPAHWYNSDGISVKELWSRFLNILKNTSKTTPVL